MTALLVAVALLLANGFFVGAEFAIIAARRNRIEQLAAEGRLSARLALASMRELSTMLAGAQLGITMASLGLGYVAEPAVARFIEAGLGTVVDLPTGVLHAISFPVALTIVVYLHMVIGEMVPKNIAIAEPERSVLWLAVPFRIYAVMFRPVIRFLNWLANMSLRAMGVPPREELETVHTAEDLAVILAEARREGMIEDFDHRLLSSALYFSQRDAGEVMVPRTEMVGAPITTSAAEIEALMVESGHSRVPLYRESLDDVAGFVHAKDLLKVPVDGRHHPVPPEVVRSLVVVPETIRLDPLLVELRRRRAQMALIVDEHGGTAGLVTIEDVVEELVGDIRDEHDSTERRLERFEEGHYTVSGLVRIDELGRAIGLRLPEGDYETVGGYLMDRLGRIAEDGDTIHHEGWMLSVTAMDGRRVDRVELTAPRAVEERDEAGHSY
ncbi:MAG: hemolysin family protein [Acidimicrobiia bacterium]